MRPLWLDLACTPMAAPETRWLRAMRRTLLVGFLLIATGITFLPTVAAVLGRVGTGMLAGLCLALAVLLAVYATAKMRADAAWLSTAGEEEGR